MISFDLTGKVAVVTGASSGLGQQFARALSEQGCDVAILARRKERLEEFSKELKQNGHDCLPVSCDVTDEESIKNAVKAVVDHFGKIDILPYFCFIIIVETSLAMRKTPFKSVSKTLSHWAVV